jgi:hypothetical protein
MNYLPISRTLFLALVLTAGCHARRPVEIGMLRAPARVVLAHADGFALRQLTPTASAPLDCRVTRLEADLRTIAADTLWLANVLVYGRAARRQPCGAGPSFVVLSETPALTPTVVTVSRGRTVLAVLGGLTTLFVGGMFIAFCDAECPW